MGVTWTPSAAKHGISREDVLYALAHADARHPIEGHPGWTTLVHIGHPHAQTDRYIEVMTGARGTEYVIFHAMPLTDLYRHLID